MVGFSFYFVLVLIEKIQQAKKVQEMPKIQLFKCFGPAHGTPIFESGKKNIWSKVPPTTLPPDGASGLFEVVCFRTCRPAPLVPSIS